MKITEKYQDIERSIIKTYRKEIWTKFTRAVKNYQLVGAGDRIMVCISGGKDSMLLAKCFQELKRHGQVEFDLEFVVMNPGYNEENMQLIHDNAAVMNIPIRVFETEIFDVVVDIEDSPCYLCARMRRGHLYSYARDLGCNKIALGHHYDDVVETILMSMLYSGQIKTMMPKLHSSNFPGLELIRPLYLVREDSVIAWARHNGLRFLQCACRFTELTALAEHEHVSKRREMKQLVSQFREMSPIIDKNIFTSMENINLEAIIGYKNKDGKHNFLDTY